MNLNFSNWEPFKLSDLFYLYNGAGITKEEIECNPGDFVAVQSGEENNGCIGKIDKTYCIDMGYTYTDEPCLTVARTGSAGYVAYQPFGCVVGDSAKILILKDESAKSALVYLFLKTILMANRYKYTYGRKVTKDKYLSEVVMLPAISSECPDWNFMRQYIKSLRHRPLATANRGGYESHTLGVETWKTFKVNDLFEVKYGINMELNTCIEAEPDDTDAINFVARTESNNGVSARVKPVNGKEPQPAGLITCAGGGSVLSTFLQEEPFYSGRDLYLLIPLYPMSKLAKLFCITVLKANKYRYSYGRQANITLPYLELMLPVNAEGAPDFDFMENYMKSLPYGDRI